MSRRLLPHGVWGFVLVLGLSGCWSTTSPDPVAPSVETTATEPVSSSEPPVVDTKVPQPVEPDDFQVESDFQALSLADFAAEPAVQQTWSERQQVLFSTGKPKGYLYSHASFRNFTWRLEFRYPRSSLTGDEAEFAGNTGFLVYITGTPKVWPLCLEIQGKHSEMGEIRPNGGAEKPEVQDDVARRLSARRPVGEWNAVEIVSRDGSLQVTLNGQQVVTSQPNFLSEGSIGLQAENFPWEIRRMRIRIDP